MFSLVDLFTKKMKGNFFFRQILNQKILVSYWDTSISDATNKVIGSTVQDAPLFAKDRVLIFYSWNPRLYGPMDKAPAYGAGDSRFESG